MDVIKALLLKLVIITVILSIVVGAFFGLPFTDVLILSVIYTGLSFLGDMFILPRITNVTATIADFVLAWIGVYVLGYWLFGPYEGLWIVSLTAAFIIAIGEYFFHRYMKKQVFNESRTTSEERPPPERGGDMQTEFGEDLEERLATKDPKNMKKQQ
ncbi:ABC-type protease/lipase transport system fused ATPase/permease subunit [Geomicrobium halophilum]|uniref:ABC-type protease/lipase transport system fused ATPase/permease subunit n=1 Tax=Geomicrobium halophilum TaxID=549000 RepID=A0A841PQD4_9BACL|nr:YndM family protein [Geomicrobium halophilum]MBB6448521.1 ABC-type protease/lipase transport system fused ATPase/permease subunit [Geomicrobium halophilum]